MEREQVRINDLTDQWRLSHTGGLLNRWPGWINIWCMTDNNMISEQIDMQWDKWERINCKPHVGVEDDIYSLA